MRTQLKHRAGRSGPQLRSKSPEQHTRTLSTSCRVNVDWSHISGPPKDQQACGSCWAFSTTTALAAQLVIEGKSKQAAHISEQYLVDCDASNAGCNGGEIDRALEFLDSEVTIR